MGMIKFLPSHVIPDLLAPESWVIPMYYSIQLTSTKNTWRVTLVSCSVATPVKAIINPQVVYFNHKTTETSKIQIFIFILGGAYELWQFGLENGVSPKDLSSTLARLDLSGSESLLCGAFSTLFGPANSGVLLWKHKSLDGAQHLRSNWDEFSKSKTFLFC